MTTCAPTLAFTAQPTVIRAFLSRASVGLAVWRQRRLLARLDDAALADIGISRVQALAEARRPLWDLAQS